jgi:hypothetical protein
MLNRATLSDPPPVEKSAQTFEEIACIEKQNTREPLQLDRHGLPLNPQPSKYRDDPLVSVLPYLYVLPCADSDLLCRTGVPGSSS